MTRFVPERRVPMIAEVGADTTIRFALLNFEAIHLQLWQRLGGTLAGGFFFAARRRDNGPLICFPVGTLTEPRHFWWDAVQSAASLLVETNDSGTRSMLLNRGGQQCAALAPANLDVIFAFSGTDSALKDHALLLAFAVEAKLLDLKTATTEANQCGSHELFPSHFSLSEH